ncbi:Very-long-chain 3-oxoacyl-CoA reductase [Lachnellula subtilissima]|uniref:Very-long-chain 3-oxoacyl-CoA reductase n=1 Tax=Lachnellula subtilissima TaxID=602034 RepID=A0A8H8RNR6_9HELO|nr:Very-long-chain 3-oxoacyl-CoA reductase [Lachnellula subtilissima]
MSIFANILTLTGAITLLTLLFKTARFIHIYTRPSSLPRYLHTSPSGKSPWALVTGASDGIGKGYSHELASHGFNIILHGRNPYKLCSVRASIQASYPKTQIRLMVLDATACTAADIAAAVKELVCEGLHVTVLVNNVGTGTTPSGHVFANYEDEEPSDIDAIINTNARFPALITHFVLPILQTPALILTMGSISDVGSPYISVYSGTKAFDSSFSKALRREMVAEGRDVEVLAMMTAMVTETGTSNGEVSIVQPDARVFARSALQRVGCGHEAVEGWCAHWLVRAFTQCIPDSWLTGMLIGSVRVAMEEDGKRKGK